MATALWVFYDIALGVVGFFFMDRKLTAKEKIVIAGLVVVGLAIAVYSGYSDHEDSVLMSSLKQGQDFSKGQLDVIGKILGSKLTLAPDTNAAVIANAAASKIDALERR